MDEITTVGLDMAKRVVSLCGEDAADRIVVKRPLRWEAVLAWFTQRAPCLIGMDACASAHCFAHVTDRRNRAGDDRRNGAGRRG